ncbi:elongation factor P 5-aminopentanone reductase [Oceanobacillus halotolerans]|uniref:elongation factor P 5-aminopentanone reductase n=1 Tax=Oceanobacillus halotolerans TaxID=2663380 RepID=UPI00196A0AAD|nr:SDR family oxidoreductase [Oceanobacillus halotolerans]
MIQKNILIIGASGDIGSAIAEQLACDGYQLLLHYHTNESRIRTLQNHLPEEQIISVIQADLTKNADLKKLMTGIVYPIDGIIFASGVTHFGLLQDTSEETMDAMLTVHVKAPWFITQQLLPNMIRKRAGTILLITSIWGDIGASNEVIYSSVKGAQNSFVKALAKEVAGSGISVNAISPGFIDTKMNDHFTDQERKAIVRDIPMNRAGKPEEVAQTVSFLMDHKSNYIQGEVIHVKGAW